MVTRRVRDAPVSRDGSWNQKPVVNQVVAAQEEIGSRAEGQAAC